MSIRDEKWSWRVGELLNPQQNDPTFNCWDDALQLAYNWAKKDPNTAICIWEHDDRENTVFLNGERYSPQ